MSRANFSPKSVKKIIKQFKKMKHEKNPFNSHKK
jgi:hypothetical protein